eukprot:12431233-Karenia_brevis.AAC.1
MHQAHGQGSRDLWVQFKCTWKKGSGRPGGAMAPSNLRTMRTKCGGLTLHMGWACSGPSLRKLGWAN